MVSERPEPHHGSPRSPLTRVDFVVAAQKRQLRGHARRRREEISPEEQWEKDLARFRHLLPLVPRGAVLATYLSRSTEPSTAGVVAVLWRRGHRILAPVVSCRGGIRREPAWGWYAGPSYLKDGPQGIPEPVGEALPPEALAAADIVIVAGLAAGRDGSRVGAGAGWFDRALSHVREDAQVWLLVNECEVADSVPSESHDRPVSRIITESGVITVEPREESGPDA